MAKRHLLDKQRNLITKVDPDIKFRVEESYKAIRTNLVFSVMKKGCKVITITSALPGEGKTTTSVNIAISLASSDFRVLLIDCDLRKPKVHRFFKFTSKPGLSNYLNELVLSDHIETMDALVHRTEYENLSVLCAGVIPPNPAEMLASEQMAQAIHDFGKDYDYIILDTPPLNIVSDSIPLAKLSDGVALVVRNLSSTHIELEKALRSLEFIDAKVLGFILNGAEVEKKGYYSYHYEYGRNN